MCPRLNLANEMLNQNGIKWGNHSETIHVR